MVFYIVLSRLIFKSDDAHLVCNKDRSYTSVKKGDFPRPHHFFFRGQHRGEQVVRGQFTHSSSVEHMRSSNEKKTKVILK